MKKKMSQFIVKVESTLQKTVDNLVKESGFSVSDLKQAHVKIHNNLTNLNLKNNENGSDLFKILNKLKSVEVDLKTAERQMKEIKGSVGKVSSLKVSAVYNKRKLDKLLELKIKKLHKEINKSMEKSSLISISRSSMLKDSISNEKPIEKLNLVESIDLNSLEDDLAKPQKHVPEKQVSKPPKRSKSLLKRNTLEFNVNRSDIHMRKGSGNRLQINRLNTLGTNIIDKQYNKLTQSAYPMVDSPDRNKSIFSASPVKKDFNQLNIYNPSTKLNLVITPTREVSKTKEVPKTKRKPSTVNMPKTPLSKQSTLTIKGKRINPLYLRKVLMELTKKQRDIKKIIFKENDFDFDVLPFIKDFFKNPLEKTVHIDLRNNRIKIDNKKVEYYKKQIFLFNIKIIL